MRLDVLTIVGVGLIGGSIGLAVRQRGLARCVRGVGRRGASLERALAIGALDEAFTDVADAVPGSELIVFCTPVDGIAEQVLAAAPLCGAGCVLTDAGSTKGAIVRAVEARLPAGIAFVGGHPLAGSEKRGPDSADADLFRERVAVLTPTAHTDPFALARVAAFWQALGARVRTMTPDEHDAALAQTSHLPHLAAAALAGVVPEGLLDLAATGLRDTTRIAAGDPSLWSAIFLQNAPALLAALDDFAGRLDDFRHALQATDRSALDELLAQGKKVRDALGS